MGGKFQGITFLCVAELVMLEVRDEKVMWGLVVIPRIVGFFSRGKRGNY